MEIFLKSMMAAIVAMRHDYDQMIVMLRPEGKMRKQFRDSVGRYMAGRLKGFAKARMDDVVGLSIEAKMTLAAFLRIWKDRDCLQNLTLGSADGLLRALEPDMRLLLGSAYLSFVLGLRRPVEELRERWRAANGLPALEEPIRFGDAILLEAIFNEDDLATGCMGMVESYGRLADVPPETAKYFAEELVRVAEGPMDMIDRIAFDTVDGGPQAVMALLQRFWDDGTFAAWMVLRDQLAEDAPLSFQVFMDKSRLRGNDRRDAA